MPHFGQNSSPTKLLTKTDSAKPVHNEADGRPDNPEVYKYRLLPQTSVEPNTTWLGDTFSTRSHPTLSCTKPMISSSTFDISVLFLVLTRAEHIMIIQGSQLLLILLGG
jgi:hypothetical protein